MKPNNAKNLEIIEEMKREASDPFGKIGNISKITRNMEYFSKLSQ